MVPKDTRLKGGNLCYQIDVLYLWYDEILDYSIIN